MYQSQISTLVARLDDVQIDPSISRNDVLDTFSARGRRLVALSQVWLSSRIFCLHIL